MQNNAIRETEEETGYRLTTVHKIMETYMSPGAVTEILYLFVNMTNP
jgi:8-oxo-dGTP pyrophosphatase MutT (NUDIX family)